jgi:RNA polymerase sigma-70 factor (ECF subfamily)
VASETWLQVSRDISRYRGDHDGFGVWLFRVARHRAIDNRRWVRRRPEELVEPASLPEAVRAGAVRPETVSPDAWTEAAAHLDTDWALGVIATLPPDQAEAVLLRVVVGLDVAGTAKVLGKRPGAVRVAALRGLRRLAEHTEVRQRRPAIPAAVANRGVTSWNSATPG